MSGFPRHLLPLMAREDLTCADLALLLIRPVPPTVAGSGQRIGVCRRPNRRRERRQNR